MHDAFFEGHHFLGVAINHHGELLGTVKRNHYSDDPYMVYKWDRAGQKSWELEMQWPWPCALGDDGTAYIGDRGEDKRPSTLRPISATGAPMSPRRLPLAAVQAMALSPDGDKLALVGDDYMVVQEGSAATKRAITAGNAPIVLPTSNLRAQPVQLKKGHSKATGIHVLTWSDDGATVFSIGSASPYRFTYCARDAATGKICFRGKVVSTAPLGSNYFVWKQGMGFGDFEIWSPGAKQPTDQGRIKTPDVTTGIATRRPMASLLSGRFMAILSRKGVLVVSRDQSTAVAFHSYPSLVADAFFVDEAHASDLSLYTSPRGTHVLIDFEIQRRSILLDAEKLVG